jgi:hypothetical protein
MLYLQDLHVKLRLRRLLRVMNQCTVDTIHTSAAIQSEHSQVEATVCVSPIAYRIAIAGVPVGAIADVLAGATANVSIGTVGLQNYRHCRAIQTLC